MVFLLLSLSLSPFYISRQTQIIDREVSPQRGRGHERKLLLARKKVPLPLRKRAGGRISWDTRRVPGTHINPIWYCPCCCCNGEMGTTTNKGGFPYMCPLPPSLSPPSLSPGDIWPKSASHLCVSPRARALKSHHSDNGRRTAMTVTTATNGATTTTISPPLRSASCRFCLSTNLGICELKRDAN